MREYDFMLHFALPRSGGDAACYIARLHAEGCDEAMVDKRRIALHFKRSAPSPDIAVLGALAAAMRALPGARLVDARATGA